MKVSLAWLNSLLDPGNLSATEAEHLLTFAGFPIESIEPVAPIAGQPGVPADVCMDVEVTSNRGDMLCHAGVAREIHAASARGLATPGTPGSRRVATDRRSNESRSAESLVGLVNHIPEQCPRFTARIIRGVTVGPSPAWLVQRLHAVGQRSINNVVDVTNYIALELGQPTHAFDLARFAHDRDGIARIAVRTAAKGETLTLLDGKAITLAGDELVVADGVDNIPVSLAGIMGGQSTQVTASTTDVLFEAATWAPAAIRRAARRFNLRTDASHRFERIVDPRTVTAASARAIELLLSVAGGELLPGELSGGSVDRPLTTILLRPERCQAVLGVQPEIPALELIRILRALDIDVSTRGAALLCTVPANRPDLEREIDLIEEIARIHGLDKLPIHPRIAVAVREPQRSEAATRTLASVLTAQGFHETVTFTFVSTKAAKPFLPTGMTAAEVCDTRRKADPVLRPSILCSLLACRRANQDSGADRESLDHGALITPGVRLFELSSVFAQESPVPSPAKSERLRERETVNLALVADACFPSGSTGAKVHDQKQAAIRLLRGTLDTLALALSGRHGLIQLEPLRGSDTPIPVAAFDPAASSAVLLGASGDTPARRIGLLGLCSSGLQSQLGLETPVVMAEVALAPLLDLFPPRASVQPLPGFPSIERDLSLIVTEDVTWDRIRALIQAASLPQLEDAAFVTTYRGTQTGPGRKSVTLRLRFRDHTQTLRHEEIDAPVNALIDLAKRELGAELRA